ncbi:hypothetical protein H257_05285 [Aphanomyces astaci]|uniref:Uncharacterized protein n=1 Tax=Aphanomyces astaci TaxID=112090 RepID=W4GS09_APHAT|nr:hypothetical protein H257_05285 [Aphanomyces astaci]ETV81668.1 hypothetical protein H257_05285 [Aphanomyces astaci]|eukprot:XP_009828405.1 hypothetical protein H257_05285 [Aphanomyces astaci]
MALDGESLGFQVVAQLDVQTPKFQRFALGVGDILVVLLGREQACDVDPRQLQRLDRRLVRRWSRTFPRHGRWSCLHVVSGSSNLQLGLLLLLNAGLGVNVVVPDNWMAILDVQRAVGRVLLDEVDQAVLPRHVLLNTLDAHVEAHLLSLVQLRRL